MKQLRLDGIERDALLSPCKTWRWWLSRIWDPTKPIGLLVLINPSKADDAFDDPTVTDLMKRGRVWGWGGFYIVNLFAYRSSDPDDLLVAADPIGPEADAWIVKKLGVAVAGGGQVVVAWGKSHNFASPKLRAEMRGRDRAVLDLLARHVEVIWCIQKNGDGTPKHPAARGTAKIPADVQLEVFSRRAA